MLSDAPPSRELVTISRTCRELVEVNTLTNSGITAPASVPQLITLESFHHSDVSPPSSGIIIQLRTYVRPIERTDVSQTSVVSAASKFILSAFAYRAFAIRPSMK